MEEDSHPARHRNEDHRASPGTKLDGSCRLSDRIAQEAYHCS